MFAGLFGTGYAMARYRQNGFLKKLATTPLSRTESSWLSCAVAARSSSCKSRCWC
jgi:hypothetical protein